MKQLLPFGCSFTDGQHGVGWPNRLAELMGRELTNYGKGSAGNFYISSKIVEAVSKLEEQDVYVVVMWSGIDREDLVVSKYEHNFTNEEAMELGYTDTDITNASGDWFHSGGMPIPSATDSTISITDYVVGSRFFEWFWGTFFKNYHTFENSYLKSLNNMLTTQNLLKLKNIPYKFVTFKDIFSQSFGKYKSAESFENLIDWDKFHFEQIGKEKFCGEAEWVELNKLTRAEDNIHPTVESHYKYAEHLYEIL